MTQKGFWQIIVLKFKDDPIGWIEYGFAFALDYGFAWLCFCYAFAFHLPKIYDCWIY